MKVDFLLNLWVKTETKIHNHNSLNDTAIRKEYIIYYNITICKSLTFFILVNLF
jgi:hypothetical protein